MSDSSWTFGVDQTGVGELGDYAVTFDRPHEESIAYYKTLAEAQREVRRVMLQGECGGAKIAISRIEESFTVRAGYDDPVHVTFRLPA